MRSSLLAFDRISNDSIFKEHTLALFQYQFEHNAVYRSYCDLININPSDVKEINDIPFLPIQFFKSHMVCSSPNTPTNYFESSGTSGQIRSKHYVVDYSIYHKSFEKGFELFYGSIEDYTLIALLPSYLEREDRKSVV